MDSVTAGEDVFVLAGTTANLTAITAGDDLTVRADGGITGRRKPRGAPRQAQHRLSGLLFETPVRSCRSRRARPTCRTSRWWPRPRRSARPMSPRVRQFHRHGRRRGHDRRPDPFEPRDDHHGQQPRSGGDHRRDRHRPDGEQRRHIGNRRDRRPGHDATVTAGRREPMSEFDAGDDIRANYGRRAHHRRRLQLRHRGRQRGRRQQHRATRRGRHQCHPRRSRQ